jgi:hypothetical protein
MTFRIETKAQVAWLTDGGLLRATSKPGVDLTLEDAEDLIRQLAAQSNGIRRPILVDLTGLKSMSRDARAYFAGPETAKVESAAALLVLSPMARAIGNFFMGLNKGATPARIFTSEPLAIEWLQPYLP